MKTLSHNTRIYTEEMHKNSFAFPNIREQQETIKAPAPCVDGNYTLGTSMKLGLAVEMSPKVFSEQFTSCESMSHAASADSVLLSTWKI